MLVTLNVITRFFVPLVNGNLSKPAQRFTSLGLLLTFFSYSVICQCAFREVLLLLLWRETARTAPMLAQNFVDPFSVLIWESVTGRGIIRNSKAAFQNKTKLTTAAELELLILFGTEQSHRCA